jgi:hypothetical protein
MHVEAIAGTEAYISAHAVSRGQQRGIRQSDRDLVFQYGDREVPARRGCYRLSISEKMMRQLLRDGSISPSCAERCKHLTLITDGCTVITNYRAVRYH